MAPHYWIIDYTINILSDFHVGAGITILGGNLHGLQRDKTSFPYLPHTQVRGLLRLGGLKLKNWQPHLTAIFNRNFGQPNRRGGGLWSYTSARYPKGSITGYSGPEVAEILTEQNHIKLTEDVVENLFSYEKAGGKEDELREWKGRIYSAEPAEEKDVAFLIACMRAEDRIGHRRSRGYGKVNWDLGEVYRYLPGERPEQIKRGPNEWTKTLIITREVNQ